MDASWYLKGHALGVLAGLLVLVLLYFLYGWMVRTYVARPEPVRTDTAERVETGS